MTDLGRDALELLIGELMIDDEWSVDGDHVLSWTAWRLGETFSVVGPYMSYGMPVYRITSTVPVVERPRAPNIEQRLNLINHISVSDALIYDDNHDAVLSEMSMVFHEEVFDWKLRLFSRLAIVQLAQRERMADDLVDLLQGRLSQWSHPVQGPREDPDEMLDVLPRVFAAAGDEPSRFAQESEFEAVLDWLDETPFFSAGVSAQGMAIEVPFGVDDTSLIMFSAADRHPGLGSGLLIGTRVRQPGPTTGATQSIAARLNRSEAEAPSSDLFGAWIERDGELAHSRFLPNALYQPGLIQELVVAACSRAVWVDSQLHHDDPPLSRPPAAATAATRFSGLLNLFRGGRS